MIDPQAAVWGPAQNFAAVVKPAIEHLAVWVHLPIAIAHTPGHQGLYPLTLLWEKAGIAIAQPALGIVFSNTIVSIHRGHIEIPDYRQIGIAMAVCRLDSSINRHRIFSWREI